MYLSSFSCVKCFECLEECSSVKKNREALYLPGFGNCSVTPQLPKLGKYFCQFSPFKCCLTVVLSLGKVAYPETFAQGL